jgi:hypothetical protein
MHVRLACVIALTLASPCAAAQERILIALPPAFDFEPEATAKLRKDCVLAERVGNQVLTSVKERFPGAEPIGDWRSAGDTPVVRIWITQLQRGGSAGATPADSLNRMGLRAELYEASERRVFGDWRASAASRPGESLCPTFDRFAATLGKSVATWLPAALRTSAANRATAEAAAKAAAKAVEQ